MGAQRNHSLMAAMVPEFATGDGKAALAGRGGIASLRMTAEKQQQRKSKREVLRFAQDDSVKDKSSGVLRLAQDDG
jgi:hypothetical protein